MLKKYFAEFMWFVLLVYLLIAISPPFLYKAGLEKTADTVHSVYRIFCHQRVERSPFLLGEKGFAKFYTIEELQLSGVLPEINPSVPEPMAETIFGYPYVGNEYVGYKTALCIRDLSIYIALLIFGGIYLVHANKTKTVPKFKWITIIILLTPMALDGTFQLFAEMFNFTFIPEAYLASIWKRVITGGLFGVGFGMFIFSNLKESTDFGYNKEDN